MMGWKEREKTGGGVLEEVAFENTLMGQIGSEQIEPGR